MDHSRGGIILKKKVIIGIIVGLILLFPILRNKLNEIMAPDKVLIVGHQIDEHTFEFTREIKDKEKIADFENLFEQVSFWEEEKEKESYPDIIVQINHKRGISTHAFKIWFIGEEGIAEIYTTEEKLIGKLSSSQVKALKEITN